MLFYVSPSIEKILNEQCSSAALCADEAQVNCTGGVCGCNAGYYDNDGATVGGNCERSTLP